VARVARETVFFLDRLNGVWVQFFGKTEAYDAGICKNYAVLTAENSCKWKYAKKDKPEYNGCDQSLLYAEACNMTFRGHALVWGKEGSNPTTLQPSHADYGHWNATQKRAIIVEHVKAGK
jgi:GH35 family endo-1,4-beta-xylanase